MKKLLLACVLFLAACSRVPPGHVGIKVNLYGSDRGVQNHVYNTGAYWVGMTNTMYIFPTFQKQYTWSGNEEISFQNADGLPVRADIGIMFHLREEKVPLLFQTYRKGIEELCHGVLRNMVRDALVQVASTKSIEAIYGAGKHEIITEVQRVVSQQVDSLGVVIDKISLVGSFRLPENVAQAINDKMSATQRAQQRNNEIAEAQAQASKVVAEAKGAAEAVLTRARAEAEANSMKQKTLTKELIQYETIQRWDGKLPIYTGNNIPFIMKEAP